MVFDGKFSYILNLNQKIDCMLTLLTNITGLFKLSKKDIERLWDILVINVFYKKESKLLYSCLDK